MKRLIVTAGTVGVMLFAAFSAQAADSTKAAVAGKSDTLKWAESNFHYVGEKKCKMCHRKQYASWAKTKHANAWADLQADSTKKPECMECHITGKNKADSTLVNVGCEVCHGPGSKYKSMKTMKNIKLATAAGLLPVTEKTCIRCHNKRSPFYKKFDFATAVKAGVHEHFKKKGK